MIKNLFFISLSILLFMSPTYGGTKKPKVEPQKPSSAVASAKDQIEVEELKRTISAHSQAIEELKAQVKQQSEEIDKLESLLRESKEEAQTAKFLAEESKIALSQRVAEFTTKLETLKVEADKQEENIQKVEKKAMQAGWTSSHPYIKTPEGNFEIEFGGRMQADFRAFQGGSSALANTFLLRRARLEAFGKLYKHYEFKVQADFVDRRSRVLRDAFININYIPELQFKFGQFKEPFSQEELLSSKYIDFVERTMAVNSIAPSRDLGVMFHGNLLKEAISYGFGVFNGSGILSTNPTDAFEFAERIVFSPFKKTNNKYVKGLRFGGAYVHGRKEPGGSLIGKTAGGFTFFEPIPTAGSRTRANGEIEWLVGQFSLKGEYLQSREERLGQGRNKEDLPALIGSGWYISGTWLITGEEKRSGAISPKRSFLGKEGRGPGAIELAFRYEQLRFDDRGDPNIPPSLEHRSFNIAGNQARAFTIGVNWWMNKFVRYQSNFVFETFEDRLRAPRPGKKDFFTYLSRIQVIF